ncbi:MAG: hypothetical protein JXA67_12560 [Micromonosporaceae bacterium]|nr:hypothetical protein [Micromonosporaceae bacterium]
MSASTGMIGVMGFWGTLVVHRSESLLWELLPEVRQLDDARLCHDSGTSRWQVTRVFTTLDGLPVDFIASVRDATAAPVLVADVLDSDAACLTGLGVHTPTWQAWLQLDKALGHLVAPPSPFDADGTYLGDHWRDPDYEQEVSAVRARLLQQIPGQAGTVTERAMSWAKEAGLQPATLGEVTKAFDAQGPFAEDLFFGVLQQLGLAVTEVAAPDAAPTIVQVLHDLLGRRLAGIQTTPHRPVRGERLTFPDMPDLRLAFDGGHAVTACGCHGEFTLLPAPVDGDTVTTAGTTPPPAGSEACECVGRHLTDAATLRRGYLPDLHGILFRFASERLLIAAVDSRWVITTQTTTPEELSSEYALRMNAWIATRRQQGLRPPAGCPTTPPPHPLTTPQQ